MAKITVGASKTAPSQSNSKKTAILIGIIIALLLIFGTMFILMYNQLSAKNSNQGALVLDSTAKDKNNTNTVDNILLAGYDDITLAERGSIALENPEANAENNVYIKYEIIDNDTEKTIYETDLIDAGKQVIWIPSETLKPGEYKIAFVQHPYIMQDSNFLPTMTVGKNDIILTVN